MRAVLDTTAYVVTDPGGKPCHISLQIEAAYGWIDNEASRTDDGDNCIEYVDTKLVRLLGFKHSTVTYRDTRDGVITIWTVWEL